MTRVVIFGGSGHAKVIVDIIENQTDLELIGLIDNFASIDAKVLGYSVLGNNEVLPDLIKKFNFTKGIIGIGDNSRRSYVAKTIKSISPEFEFVNCIHTSAKIGKSISLGQGNVIMPGVVINACSTIENHSILNTNSSIDHDCHMKDFSSIGPNCAVGGNSSIGEYSAIGIGASVFHNIKIADNCIVGGGSIVTKNTHANSVYFGSPAKFIRNHNLGDKYL